MRRIRKYRRKVLIIGFQGYNQKMYPHLYDVIMLLKKHFEIVYTSIDDKGVFNYRIQKIKEKISMHPFNIPGTLKGIRDILIYRRSLSRISKEAKKTIIANDFDIIIVTHHSSLNYIANYIDKKTKLIFWSLDILTKDYGWGGQYRYLKKVIDLNIKNKDLIDSIIIQDKNRAKVLDKIIHTQRINKFFLPVSLYKNLFSQTVSVIKNKQIFLKNKPIVMQIGAINNTRSSDILLKHYQENRDKFDLIFLGGFSDEILSQIHLNKNRPIIYKTQKSYKNMRRIISKSNIGFISFSQKNTNNFYYSKASGQLVEFYRLGIPVIVLDSEEIGNFVEKQKAGIHINNLNRFNAAIKKIRGNYLYYSKNSSLSYKKFFNLELYEKQLVNFIENYKD